MVSSSPIHKASLVDPALHSPALLELLEIKLSRPVIEYVVDCVVETVNYAMGRPSSSSRGRSMSRRPEHTKFTTFVTNVLTRAEVTLPTLLVSLVYINRAKPHLQIALEEWACERVFLGAVMVASKFSNDSTLKNVHWALCTGVFGKRDVGRIEREFLDVLDFDLSLTEDDILNHHDGLSSVSLPSPSHDFRRLSSYAPSHAHTQYSRSHNVGCPNLDPSSPHSSSSGSSPQPRTPEAGVSAEFVVKTGDDGMDVIPPPPPPKKAHHSSSTMDLLRAFPLPVPHSRQPGTMHKPHNRYSHFPFKNPSLQVSA
ncbi:hypothetical protein CY34DRAFT_91859 [Suillus luteus UH-Slu-Lm8-n1]|uniref:Cyclin N-terminal domain-containing protein n=1 Tax=Suillus luteus UH-Slu-Lm8-n1 TaxID=930992 RepID=A0A0D0AUE2_9AGAM|nr:hypothetical protein CY34DRAFT_91859 [Suillus luteus UH-Slu-Lm8-n1]